MECPFCFIEEKIFENEKAFAIFDKYPVNKGHMLIISKQHVSDYFYLTEIDRRDIDSLLIQCKHYLDENYRPDGYNVGINCGQVSGQTIFHVHIHLIPRYKGDMQDPRGGVRGVIPEKRIY